MDPLDRVVAGLRCREVLSLLGDFVDGDLVPEVLTRVRGHLAGCDACDRFGGRVTSLVALLRTAAMPLGPIPEDAMLRLRDRLRAERG